MEAPWLPMLVMFGSMLLAILLGVPIAFAVGGVSTVLICILWSPAALGVVAAGVWEDMNAFLLIAVPLFILMGNLLLFSGIADDLFGAIHLWSGSLRGTLAMTTVVVCILYGAMTGVVGAAVTSMGLIAVPSMLRRNYNRNLVAGIVPASGSLAILVPPSVPIIVYCMTTGESVGMMFAAGLATGLLLAILFCLYIIVRVVLQPEFAPAFKGAEKSSFRVKLLVTRALILPSLIILSVLGAIFSGAASPTEASALGCIACIFAIIIRRRLTWQNLKKSCVDTLNLTGMILWILIASLAFKSLWIAIGAQQFILALVKTLPVHPWVVILGVLFILFVLGMLMDPLAIILICAPIFLPIAKFLGFDPLWFSIMFMSVITLGYITPPYGVSLFYLKGVAPNDLTMQVIFRSSMPFILIWIVSLICLIFLPQIATWLPNVLLGPK